MEKSSTFYDDLFTESQMHNASYEDSPYYVMWTQIIQILRKMDDTPRILEVGCGTGQFAQYLTDKGFTDYQGFDFSEVAIEKARERLDYKFWVGDALDQKNYTSDPNIIISLEVFEHIKNELSILSFVKRGTKVILSLPRFDSESHVRWFLSERQVKSRYYRHIDITRIVRISEWYVVYGVVDPVKPNLMGRLLKTRRNTSMSSILFRIKFHLKNRFKLRWIKL